MAGRMLRGRTKGFRGWLVFLIAAVLLGSTLFVTSAENSPVVEVIPQELDVRAAGSVLRGGSLPVTAPGADAPANQSAVRALAQSRAVDAAQTKALQSLQSVVGSRLGVEYNKPAGTPRHLMQLTVT